MEPKITDKFNRIRVDDSSEESEISCMMIGSIRNAVETCIVDIIVQGFKLAMEIDTGSAVAVISEIKYKRLFFKLPISKCDKTLVVVNGSKIAVVGEILVEVTLNGINAERKLIVLKTSKNFTPLLGKDWLGVFFPNWMDQFTLNSLDVSGLSASEKLLSTIKQKYLKVFEKDCTKTITGYDAELTLKSEQPIFRKAYQVPFKIKDKFLEHLDMLENQGVITSIKASEWASPVIAVMKKDREIRMVIDCKVSLNKILIPNTLSSSSGRGHFCFFGWLKICLLS